MADASHPFDARRRRPRDWGEAFSNLPLDTPPLSVWSNIAARLDATEAAAAQVSPSGDANEQAAALAAVARAPMPAARRHVRMRTWLALAASLSALALLPMLWSGSRQSNAVSPAAVATTPPVRTTPADAQPAPDASLRGRDRRSAKAMPSASSNPLAANRTAMAAVAATVEPATDRIVPDQTIADQAVIGRAVTAPAVIDRAVLDAAPQLADASAPASANPPLRVPREASAADTSGTTPAASPNAIASAAPARSTDSATLPPNAVLVGDTDADATASEMELLYAASAQLETLLTYTRDPRVETGPAAALSSEIHTRLAKIDARLAQPGLSSNEQFALWHARVGTLRQAVAVESELRALSAEGRGYEGKLVEVY